MARRTDAAVTALAALLVLNACEAGDADRIESADSSAAIVDTMDRAAEPSGTVSTEPAPSGPAAPNASAGELRAALDRLVRGATADSATWFSAQTADIIRAVEVDANGHAVVDFVDLRSVIPNASSSAGSQMLLEQLNATVFGVPGVASVEYRMAGSCDLLGEWLQYGTCLRFDRP